MSGIRARHGSALIGAVVASLLVAGSAAAAPAKVQVRDDSFGPTTVTVAPGESVTWNWVGDGHNIKLSGAEAFTTPFKNSGATFSHVFMTPGTYGYLCQAHDGMTGKVVVAGTPATPAAAPVAPAPTSAAPRISGLRASAGGALLHIELTAPARLHTTVARMTSHGWRTVKRIDAPTGGGPSILRWTNAAIARGRYRVTAVARTAAGASSPAVRRRFVVVRRIAARGGHGDD